MLHSARLQLPLENTFTNFNNSIVYFIQNVKAYAEKIAEILREKSTDRKSKKADRMLHSARLQLPLENTFISFDKSIAYFMQNVKDHAEKIAEISQEKSTEELLPVLNAVFQKHEN